MDRQAIKWMNVDSDYEASSILHRTRAEADALAGQMWTKHKLGRTACLRLVIRWQDGQGMDSPSVVVTNESEVIS